MLVVSQCRRVRATPPWGFVLSPSATLRVAGLALSSSTRSLTLSFKDGYGVIHQFSDADTVLLLVGDGVIDARETVLVPVQDDIYDAPFSGSYVLSAKHAWTVLKDFLRGSAVEDLGEWQEL